MRTIWTDRPVQDRIIVALDNMGGAEALVMADRLEGVVGGLKVGLELVHREGHRLLRELVARGWDVFYDAKLHDIPNTVRGACEAVRDFGVHMVNVHATGGSAMMDAARAGLGNDPDRPLLVAVTLLTSLDQTALEYELQVKENAETYVVQLARLAQRAGLDGVVASPQEAAAIREACGPAFRIVTPGVRPVWQAGPHDQRRVATPAEAIERGADDLVIGRPITTASDPVAAAKRVIEELSE